MRYFLAVLAALAYSLRKAVRRVVHQGLDLGEGRDVGTDAQMVGTSWSSEWGNQSSICSMDGLRETGGTRKSTSGCFGPDQSAVSHIGPGGARSLVGEERITLMGTWSDLSRG